MPEIKIAFRKAADYRIIPVMGPSGALAAQALAQRVKPRQIYPKI